MQALSPVRSPELHAHRGCVHHIATQQLDHSAVTVAGLKRTRTPLGETLRVPEVHTGVRL
jgi:hypothetical protein